MKPTIKKKGLYTPLTTPSQPWAFISVDYTYGLPSIKHGNDSVFMVVGIFSKIAILVACKKSIIAKEITKILFE